MGKSKKAKPEVEVIRPNIIRTILKGVEDLYVKHCHEILEVQDSTDDNIISFGFTIKVDCSEAEPTVRVSIRIPSAIKDSMTARLDDANQGGFKFLTDVDSGEDSDDTASGAE